MSETISYKIYLQQCPMTAGILLSKLQTELVNIYTLKIVALPFQKPISQLWPEYCLPLGRMTALHGLY